MQTEDRKRLDCRGLKCPLPVLYLRKTAKESGESALIEIEADDPLAAIDIPHECAVRGHAVLSSRAEGRVLIFLIRTAGGA